MFQLVGDRLELPLIPAGFPSPAEDYLDRDINLNDLIDHPSSTYLMRASGNSMTGAGIFDNDLLIVDRSLTAKPGHVVIACLHGEFTVKRLIRSADGLPRLVSENPAYPDPPEGEEIEIWGVVRYAVRDLK
ncbi:MAG: translesion error-prone DNA polymerase V autoproteolytic subunit [Alphaproteobacteria bacterium]